MNSNLASVQALIETDIFFPSYTHVNADTSRHGIEQTGKLMSPSIALSNKIVPFSGESLGVTYLFRTFHVSVSKYPPTEHSWRDYLDYGKEGWSPEKSIKFIAELKKAVTKINERSYGYMDFEHPHVRPQNLRQFTECMRLEEIRQQKYSELTPEEQNSIQNPNPDIYLFNENLPILWYTQLFQASRQNASHPFVAGEINLTRYLTGMFTSQDAQDTESWISQIVKRKVPVGSIDDLITWEKTMPKLSTHNNESEGENFKFYQKIRESSDFKQKVIEEVLSLQS